jgi:hypothetical protein
MRRTAVSALLAAAVLVPASPAAAKELTTLGTFAWRRRHGGPERRPAIG